MVLNLVYDLSVLEDAAVVGEIDLLWLLGELLYAATGVLVALLEGLQRADSRATKT